jgi:5'-3' exonuclease
MVEFEADDAIASAAHRFGRRSSVEQIVICSPDKDLAQLVSGRRVVSWDRRREIVYDEKAVTAKFGVRPASIPDWLALVGDSADGYPGIPGWGEKSASTVLFKYKHLEAIPANPLKWGITPGRAQRLSDSLRAQMEDARLFRRLATLRTDVPLREGLRELKWRGARPALKRLCNEIGAGRLINRIPRWAPA